MLVGKIKERLRQVIEEFCSENGWEILNHARPRAFIPFSSAKLQPAHNTEEDQGEERSHPEAGVPGATQTALHVDSKLFRLNRK